MVISPYFESLPQHPRPGRLESFSSYLLRVAAANEIQHLRDLAALTEVPVATLARLADYPLLDYSRMPARTHTAPEEFLAATFYHLGVKFGRSTRPSPLARFLRQSLGSYLRYCPVCLAANNSYRLTWRFLVLPGCHFHHCRFLERCGHCGAPVPFFSPPLRLGVCPTCRGDLRRCSPERLTEQESRAAAQRALDLEYLLLPPHREEGGVRVKEAGQAFARLRRERGLFVRDVAALLGVSESHIQGIELGGVHQGASFDVYVRYVDSLGVVLRDVFSGASHVRAAEPRKQGRQHAGGASQSPISPRQQHECELLDRVREAIEHLKASGSPLTSRGISQAVGMSRQGLLRYQSIRAVWGSLTRELDEATNIGKLVGVSPGGLRYYARVRALLKQASNQHLLDRKRQNQLGEDALLAQVQAVIARLQGAGQPITHGSISSGVGLSLHRLRLSPRVQIILDQVRSKGRLGRREQAHLREQALAAQVQQAMEHLRAAGQPLTRRAVGEVVGLSPKALARYSQVRILLSQVTEECRWNGPLRTRQRESELYELASRAVERLREQGQSLTQKSIAQQVGLTGAALMYYPRFRTLYYHLVEENRQARLRQTQRREEALIGRMQEAIDQLQAQGVALTLQAIRRTVGMSLAGLRSYPRIRALLQVVADERRVRGGQGKKQREEKTPAGKERGT